MQQKIENIKWQETPATREWKKQHKKKTDDALCLHLKGIYLGNKYEADREGEAPYHQRCVRCKICDKELGEWELKQIKTTLKNFNK